MIDINLVPPALRKSGKGNANALNINIPHDILLGVGAGLVFLIVTVHLVLTLIWLVQIGRLSHHQVQWQKVLPDKTVLDAIYKESGELRTENNLLAGMTTSKIVLWSPKLNAISDALPKGVWIKKLTLDRVGLTMEGSVVSKSQNEIHNVGMFLSSLKQNNNFMQDFSSLQENSIQGARNNSVEVTDFSVMAKLK